MTGGQQQVVLPQDKQHRGLETHHRLLPDASSPGCLIMQGALRQLHKASLWLMRFWQCTADKAPCPDIHFAVRRPLPCDASLQGMVSRADASSHAALPCNPSACGPPEWL